jgi:hypothetical protein
MSYYYINLTNIHNNYTIFEDKLYVKNNINDASFECFTLSNFKLYGDSDFVGVIKIPFRTKNFKAIEKNGVMNTNMFILCEKLNIT